MRHRRSGSARGRGARDAGSELGVDTRLELYNADTHVFQTYWSFLPKARDALAAAGEFVRERLGRDRTDHAPSFGR